MNRRSAITIAAGMALAVIVAAAAIAMGVTGPSSQASADTPPGATRVDPSPRVKTITRMIEVGTPGGEQGGIVTVQGTAPAPSTSSAFDDDALDDDDHGEDDAFDDDDHGDDDDDHDDDRRDGGDDHDDDD